MSEPCIKLNIISNIDDLQAKVNLLNKQIKEMRSSAHSLALQMENIQLGIKIEGNYE